MAEASIVIAPRSPRMPWRIRIGLGLTVLTLVIVVFPGTMILPLAVLTPILPTPHGCFNFLAPLLFLAFFAVGALISLFILGLGTAGVIMGAVRNPAGLVIAVLVDATVASLLLLSPVTVTGSLSGGADPGLFAVFAACAVIPVGAIVLLLLPSAYPWRRLFVATVAAAALLLVPGAVGGAAFGLQAAGISTPPPATTPTTSTHAAC